MEVPRDENPDRDQDEQHVIVRRRAKTEAVPEERGLVERTDAVGAVRVRREIEKRLRHDLAESERDDREIVAAQTQRRRPEQHAEERRDRGGDEEHNPKRKVYAELLAREHRVTVRTDRKKSGVPEIEQPRKTNDDIKPKREQNKSARIRQKVNVRVIRIENRIHNQE